MWYPLGMALALAAALVAYNTAVSLSRVGSRALVPLNVAATVGVAAAGSASGLSLDEMGLGADALGRGLLWGLALAPVAPLALGLALLVPAGVRSLRDVRLARLSAGELWFWVLVRIPLATALFEEVAFRGVLLGMLGESPGGVALSSVVFGLWHVGPAWVRSAANRPDGNWTARFPEIAGTIAATTAAGVLLALLRLHTGSVVAPVLVHLSVNVAATLAGRRASRPS